MKLMRVEDEKITMTSREISELTGKQHAHVIRDIEDEANKLGKEISQSIFGESEYTNKRGKTYKQYNLTKDGVMQIGARYDAKIRYQLIQKLKELENMYIQKEKNSYDYNRRISIDVKRVEQLDQIANKLFEKEKGILSTVIAELNNTSAKKMNKLLEKRSVIKKSKDGFGWYLEEDFKGRSLAEISNNGKIVRWTTKGTVFINQLYQANSIIYLEPDQMKLF